MVFKCQFNTASIQCVKIKAVSIPFPKTLLTHDNCTCFWCWSSLEIVGQLEQALSFILHVRVSFFTSLDFCFVCKAALQVIV